MVAKPSRPVAERGDKRSVEYAVRTDETSPAKEFIDGLSLSDQAKLANLFRRTADLGEIVHREKFKQLRGEIWEFKAHQIRVLCFRDGNAWVLTHGFIKKRDNVRTSEIDRADDIRDEDLARKRRGSRGTKR